MTADSLHQRIRDFILRNYLFTDDASAVGLDDSLIGSGIVSSVAVLEIVMFIEHELGVQVRDEEVIPENFDSINRIAAFVAARRRPG